METLAYQIVDLWSESDRAFSYLLFIGGAVLAAFTWKSNVRLLRAPFYAYGGIVSLVLGICSLTWLNVFAAMEGRYLWLLIFLNMLAIMASGYTFCILAKARSRDIGGSGWMTALAFLPPFSLILALKKSTDPNSGEQFKAPKLFTEWMGVSIGILLVAATAAIQAYAKVEIETETKLREQWPLKDQIAFVVRARGLEQYLSVLATQVTLPIKIDDGTTLTSITPTGKTLVRTFVVSSQNIAPLNSLRTAVRKNVCSNEVLLALMTEGGMVLEKYVRPDGEKIAEISVEKSDCN